MLSAEDGAATQSFPEWLTHFHSSGGGFLGRILFPQVWLFPHQLTDGANPGQGPDLHAARCHQTPIIPAGCNWLTWKTTLLRKVGAAVKKGRLTSCIQLCKPPRDLGSRQRSAYQLIPESCGARAQWNFTDQMVNPMLGFSELACTCSHSPSALYKADPPLAKVWVK